MAKTRRLTANTYAIVARAVEEEVPYGIHRIFKYAETEALTEDQVVAQADQIVQAVMNGLCEVINFDAPEP